MIREGNYNRIPFMAGYNRNEVDAALVFRPPLWHTPAFLYEWRIRRNLGLTKEESARLVELYPLSEYKNKPRKAYGQMITHSNLGCAIYLGLAAAAESQDRTYLYRFDYDDYKYGKYVGALHGMEVPFVFGSIERGAPTLIYDETNIEGALELQHVIMSYWTNFARSGDPNGDGLPEWPEFNPETKSLLVLDTAIRSEPAGIQERCDFWDEFSKTHKGFEESLGRRQPK
jgi:para-nitrobenzyl esterase